MYLFTVSPLHVRLYSLDQLLNAINYNNTKEIMKKVIGEEEPTGHLIYCSLP